MDLDNSQIIRKCISVIIDGSSDEIWTGDNIKTDVTLFCCKNIITENAPKNYDIHLISDKFSSFRYDNMWDNTNEGISVSDNILRINISKSKLETQDVAGFKKWLQSNPITVVYQLATPITEDIEVSSNTLTDFATSCTLTIDNTIKGNIECNEVVGLIPSVEKDSTRLSNLETDNTTNKNNITNLQKTLFIRNDGVINKNVNNCFNSETGKFKANESGQYLVMCSDYELPSDTNTYVGCVLSGSSGNQNKLYTKGNLSGFTFITLEKEQTLSLHVCVTGNITHNCISNDNSVNMLIAKIN